MVNLVGYQAYQDVDKFPDLQSHLEAPDGTKEGPLGNLGDEEGNERAGSGLAKF